MVYLNLFVRGIMRFGQRGLEMRPQTSILLGFVCLSLVAWYAASAAVLIRRLYACCCQASSVFHCLARPHSPLVRATDCHWQKGDILRERERERERQQFIVV
jgi:hypothetical protein